MLLCLSRSGLCGGKQACKPWYCVLTATCWRRHSAAGGYSETIDTLHWSHPLSPFWSSPYDLHCSLSVSCFTFTPILLFPWACDHGYFLEHPGFLYPASLSPPSQCVTCLSPPRATRLQAQSFWWHNTPPFFPPPLFSLCLFFQHPSVLPCLPGVDVLWAVGGGRKEHSLGGHSWCCDATNSHKHANVFASSTNRWG